MSKEEFLMQPYESTRPIVSIGPPGCGKSFIMLNCIKEWLHAGTFAEYHMILPAFKFEQNDSYKFLLPHMKKNVFVYDAYSPILVRRLIKMGEQEETKEDKKRIFFCIDDSTIEGGNLMKSPEMVKLATMCRHYNIHTWLIMHCSKGVVPPKVRNQVKFVFLYDIPPPLLEYVYKEYVDDVDFKRLRDFSDYWYDKVQPIKFGCLLLDKIRKEYSNECNKWFTS
jgi:hypothetical protein